MNSIVNGVDVDKLAEIIRVMETDPSKASVKFQAETNGSAVHILKQRS